MKLRGSLVRPHTNTTTRSVGSFEAVRLEVVRLAPPLLWGEPFRPSPSLVPIAHVFINGGVLRRGLLLVVLVGLALAVHRMKHFGSASLPDKLALSVSAPCSTLVDNAHEAARALGLNNALLFYIAAAAVAERSGSAFSVFRFPRGTQKKVDGPRRIFD
jgi:hypothetical protein